MPKIGSLSLGSQATTVIVSDVTPGADSPPSVSFSATHSARKKNGIATIPDAVSQVSGNSTSRSSSWAICQVTTPSGSSPAGAAGASVAASSSASSPPRKDAPTRPAMMTMTIAIGP